MYAEDEKDIYLVNYYNKLISKGQMTAGCLTISNNIFLLNLEHITYIVIKLTYFKTYYLHCNPYSFINKLFLNKIILKEKVVIYLILKYYTQYV